MISLLSVFDFSKSTRVPNLEIRCHNSFSTTIKTKEQVDIFYGMVFFSLEDPWWDFLGPLSFSKKEGS